MTALTTVASLQYKAWRYPSQLLGTKVVATYLPQTSGVRIAYERVLGTLDSAAGALLGDEDLQHRGDVLLQRVEKAERVVAIQERASERRDREATLLEDKQRLEDEQRARVQQEHEAVAERHRAEAEAVARKAAERERGEDAAILRASGAILAAERDRLDAQRAKIEVRVATAQ